MSAWRKVGGLLACALLVLVACVGVFAQASPEGKIVGVIKDAAGAVVPGASVVAWSALAYGIRDVQRERRTLAMKAAASSRRFSITGRFCNCALCR